MNQNSVYLSSPCLRSSTIFFISKTNNSEVHFYAILCIPSKHSAKSASPNTLLWFPNLRSIPTTNQKNCLVKKRIPTSDRSLHQVLLRKTSLSSHCNTKNLLSSLWRIKRQFGKHLGWFRPTGINRTPSPTQLSICQFPRCLCRSNQLFSVPGRAMPNKRDQNNWPTPPNKIRGVFCARPWFKVYSVFVMLARRLIPLLIPHVLPREQEAKENQG